MRLTWMRICSSMQLLGKSVEWVTIWSTNSGGKLQVFENNYLPQREVSSRLSKMIKFFGDTNTIRWPENWFLIGGGQERFSPLSRSYRELGAGSRKRILHFAGKKGPMKSVGLEWDMLTKMDNVSTSLFVAIFTRHLKSHLLLTPTMLATFVIEINRAVSKTSLGSLSCVSMSILSDLQPS